MWQRLQFLSSLWFHFKVILLSLVFDGLSFSSPLTLTVVVSVLFGVVALSFLEFHPWPDAKHDRSDRTMNDTSMQRAVLESHITPARHPETKDMALSRDAHWQVGTVEGRFAARKVCPESQPRFRHHTYSFLFCTAGHVHLHYKSGCSESHQRVNYCSFCHRAWCLPHLPELSFNQQA